MREGGSGFRAGAAALALCLLLVGSAHSMELAGRHPARLLVAFQSGQPRAWAAAATRRALPASTRPRAPHRPLALLAGGSRRRAPASGGVGVGRAASTHLMAGAGAGAGAASVEKLRVLAASVELRERFEASLSEEDRVRLLLGQEADAALAAASGGAFRAQQFFEGLRSAQLGRVLLYSPLLPSTQTAMFRELQNEDDGVICLADRQVSGRGRGDNVWTSPEGCMCFTLGTSLRDAALLPFFQYLVSMAVYQAVSTIVGADAKKAIGLQLKWPNDIYGPNMQKVGGVLCESSVKRERQASAAAVFYICAGVGLNVDNEEPTTCLRSLMAKAGLGAAAAALTKEQLLAEFCLELEQLMAVLSEQGFGPLRARYIGMWMHTGQVVQVQEQGEGAGREQAVIRGITPSGFLMAESSQGHMLELHPDGNRLDMLQGLISTRLRR